MAVEKTKLIFQETGIFRCSVTEDLTGKIYEGEAGLKVSNVSDFRSGQ